MKTRGSVLALNRIGGWIAIIVAGTFLVLVLGAYVNALVAGDADGQDTAVAVIAGAVFALIGFVGVRMVRSVRRGTAHLMKTQHAFAITADSIEFPTTGASGTEAWPLGETKTKALPGKHGHLTLERPGSRTRTIPQVQLADPVEDVQEQIAAAQRRLANETDDD